MKKVQIENKLNSKLKWTKLLDCRILFRQLRKKFLTYAATSSREQGTLFSYANIRDHRHTIFELSNQIRHKLDKLKGNKM